MGLCHLYFHSFANSTHWNAIYENHCYMVYITESWSKIILMWHFTFFDIVNFPCHSHIIYYARSLVIKQAKTNNDLIFYNIFLIFPFHTLMERDNYSTFLKQNLNTIFKKLHKILDISVNSFTITDLLFEVTLCFLL